MKPCSAAAQAFMRRHGRWMVRPSTIGRLLDAFHAEQSNEFEGMVRQWMAQNRAPDNLTLRSTADLQDELQRRRAIVLTPGHDHH